MAKTKKVHNSQYFVKFAQNIMRSFKNIDPKPYAKYQDRSSSGSQDIELTRFFYCYNGRIEKWDINLPYSVRPIKKSVRLLFVLMPHIKFEVPSPSDPLVLPPTKGVWTDGRTTDGRA